ncbi:hypothetical protein B0H13DRAFT_1915027 [Mycena leptocephala]|nr:hypothetical protein B0H13DRAFT_1915027 [Mycena leptocephala]
MSVRIVLLLTMRENCFAARCSLASNFWILGATHLVASLECLHGASTKPQHNPASKSGVGSCVASALRDPNNWDEKTSEGAHAGLGMRGLSAVLTSRCDGSPPMSARSVRKCCAGIVTLKHLVALAMWEEEKEGARLPSHHWPCVRPQIESAAFTPSTALLHLKGGSEPPFIRSAAVLNRPSGPLLVYPPAGAKRRHVLSSKQKMLGIQPQELRIHSPAILKSFPAHPRLGLLSKYYNRFNIGDSTQVGRWWGSSSRITIALRPGDQRFGIRTTAGLPTPNNSAAVPVEPFLCDEANKSIDVVRPFSRSESSGLVALKAGDGIPVPHDTSRCLR